MAHRIELYVAVAFLFLLLPINQSATIRHDRIQSVKTHNVKIVADAEDALTYLENVAAADALRSRPKTHTIGCIELPKEEDLLNCSIIHTFSSYLKEAVEQTCVENDTEECKELLKKLNSLRQRVESLKDSLKDRRVCGIHVANICENEKPFNDKTDSENLEKLRSLLVLFIDWFSKPMA